MEGVRVRRTQFLSGQDPLGVGERSSPIPPSSLFQHISTQSTGGQCPHTEGVVNAHT
jgi:hypothetical protein